MALSRLDQLHAALQADLDEMPELVAPKTAADAADFVKSDVDETIHPSVYMPSLAGGETKADEQDRSEIIHLSHNDRDENSATESEEDEPVSLPLNFKQGVEPGLERGQQAAYGQEFCPILPVSKFPYKFVNKSHSDRVAKLFFDTGKFWTNEWDLYYIWPPQDISDKPLILIRSDQFIELVDEINKAIKGLNFSITESLYEDSLILQIPHPALSPRYLGKSTSRDDYNNMERSIPSRGHRAKCEKALEAPEARTLEAFKAQIEAAIDLNKAKSKAAKAKKKENRFQIQQEWRRQLKRSQRYLGLRPKSDPDPHRDSSLGWKELQAAEVARHIPDCVPAINFTEAAPYAFDSSVVFVCVDIEAYERAHNKITEIGFAILDVNDLKDVAPGERGQNWFSKIRARHFRISEHSHLKNSEFVSGCADRFEFGQSEFVRLEDAPAVVAACFKEPFCAPKKNLDTAEALSEDFGLSDLNVSGKRNVIFVGHDASQDINYLHQLGYNPLNLSNLLEIVDTAQLHRAWKHDANPRSLAHCLYDLDLVGWNLHNAGNDAVYTMQVLLGICVSQATTRGTWMEKQKREEEREKQVDEAVEEAIATTFEKQEGWSDVDEGDDGGAPVKTADKTGTRKFPSKLGEQAKGKQSTEQSRAGPKPGVDLSESVTARSDSLDQSGPQVQHKGARRKTKMRIVKKPADSKKDGGAGAGGAGIAGGH